jgi:hypothetical protein
LPKIVDNGEEATRGDGLTKYEYMYQQQAEIEAGSAKILNRI